MTEKKKSTRYKITNTHDYPDEHRKLLYQIVRCTDKNGDKNRFVRRPNPKNPPEPDPKYRLDPNDPDDRRHWINKLEDDRRLVLYRLNELLDPINIAQGKPVFICEGEKDVDRLWLIGLVATCNPFGAGSWRQEYSEFLNDRSVVILADNDKSGRDHAEFVARSLSLAGTPEIKVLDLSDFCPDLKDKGDVSDWLDQGGTKQTLLKLAEDITPWIPNQQNIEPLDRFFPNDKYNADRLVERYGDELRYCWKWGWMFYDGKRWNRDEGQFAAEKRARKIAEELLDLSKKARIRDLRESIFKWFNRSLSSRKIQDTLSFARSYDKVSMFPNQLDKNQYLFNCENGTIDLRTGQCQRHNPSDMITKLAPVTYDSKAECPKWLNCLNTWMKSDSDKIHYLQWLMGMCLTGDICARVFPIFHGSGKNGKSVFLDTISELMGDYAWTAAEDLLAEKSYDTHPTGVASLSGRRLVTLDESKPNMVLKTSLVKRMTGDRTMQGRFMRQDLFEFHTTHKTILITQNLPIIKETADAIWDRVCLVPWNYRIPDDQQNPHLINNLSAEWPGILNWLIEGCLAWQKAGYTLPTSEEIKTASEKYRRESDLLSDFVEEMVLLDMPGESKVRKGELYKAYMDWAKENEVKYPLSKRGFSKHLDERNIQDGIVKIEGKTARVWFGIGLRK
ncbi:MAG: hypothetical protein JRE28_13630 [Deltaproteobacteria bacterium]|nr:hypothetical protein [Deltaproteobacteria bacterium]